MAETIWALPKECRYPHICQRAGKCESYLRSHRDCQSLEQEKIAIGTHPHFPRVIRATWAPLAEVYSLDLECGHKQSGDMLRSQVWCPDCARLKPLPLPVAR